MVVFLGLVCWIELKLHIVLVLNDLQHLAMAANDRRFSQSQQTQQPDLQQQRRQRQLQQRDGGRGADTCLSNCVRLDYKMQESHIREMC